MSTSIYHCNSGNNYQDLSNLSYNNNNIGSIEKDNIDNKMYYDNNVYYADSYCGNRSKLEPSKNVWLEQEWFADNNNRNAGQSGNLADNQPAFQLQAIEKSINNNNPATMSNHNEKWQYLDVYLDLNKSGLGMSIRGGIDSPDKFGNADIYISKILADGTVHKDGRIQLGDILLEVNSVSLVNVTHVCAVNAIRNAGKYVHFHVKRSSMSNDAGDIYEQITEYKENDSLINQDEKSDDLCYTYSNEKPDSPESDCIQIELIRDEYGFGFSLTGGIDNQISHDDTRICVSKIVQNGPAQKNGGIQVGDQIVAINDTNLEHVPYNWALKAIRGSPALSIFTIRKAIQWN